MRTIILTIAFLILSAMFSCASLDSSEKNTMENRLRERIAGAYNAYKDRDFDRFLNFSVTDSHQQEKKRKISDEMRKASPPLVDYNVKEIIITEDKAKVKVETTLILDDRKDTADSYDYWIYKNREWYLLDFGKIQ